MPALIFYPSTYILEPRYSLSIQCYWNSGGWPDLPIGFLLGNVDYFCCQFVLLCKRCLEVHDVCICWCRMILWLLCVASWWSYWSSVLNGCRLPMCVLDSCSLDSTWRVVSCSFLWFLCSSHACDFGVAPTKRSLVVFLYLLVSLIDLVLMTSVPSAPFGFRIVFLKRAPALLAPLITVVHWQRW